MKLLKFATLCFAVTALVAVPTVHAQTELGGNVSFENAILADAGSTVDNWTTFVNSGTATVDTTAPLSGLQHLNLTMDGQANSFVGVQQLEQNIQVGEEYTFGFNARLMDGVLASDLGVAAEFRIEWRDAAGVEIGGNQANTQAITGSLTDQYQLFSQTLTAPAGTESLNAVIALQSFGTGDSNGTVFYDDATISGPASSVPEPGSLALIGLGMAGLATRRRRS